MCSTRSRRRLASQDVMMRLRVVALPGRILVTRKIRGRRPAMTSATSSSAAPSPYISAVSMSVRPRSMPSCSAAISCLRRAARSPSCQVPCPSTATDSPAMVVKRMREAYATIDSRRGYHSVEHLPMSHSRREFVIASSAALAASQLPTRAAASAGDSAAERVLADTAEELMVDYPESATMLGIDNGARAPLKSKLADRSAAGQQAIARRSAQRLERLRAIDPAALDPASRIDLDVVRTAHEIALDGFAFPYGDV